MTDLLYKLLFVCFFNHWSSSLASSDGKESALIQETWVRFLVQEDSPGEGNGYPL